MSEESWTCEQCQQVNASYAETCGRCSAPKGGIARELVKFRMVIDLDVPVGHMGIKPEAVADHYLEILRLQGRLALEHHLLLKREALHFHGVRRVTPPRALPAPGADTPEAPSPPSSTGSTPAPS